MRALVLLAFALDALMSAAAADPNCICRAVAPKVTDRPMAEDLPESEI